MAEPKDSSLQFFSKATPDQWSFVLSKYSEVLKLKAHQNRGFKKNGPEELIKLDGWYQEELPKLIHSRKEPHLKHEELVQVTKWKLYRGKNRSRLLDLVRINTENMVMTVTKKAFKKCPTNLCAAVSALTNLKGIGPATASAVLTAAYPQYCPFMADESMLATPGVEATDYTLAEFGNYAELINKCTDRLAEQDAKGEWTPHKVELTLWTHYLAKELNPDLLLGMPHPNGSVAGIKIITESNNVHPNVESEESAPEPPEESSEMRSPSEDPAILSGSDSRDETALENRIEFNHHELNHHPLIENNSGGEESSEMGASSVDGVISDDSSAVPATTPDEVKVNGIVPEKNDVIHHVTPVDDVNDENAVDLSPHKPIQQLEMTHKCLDGKQQDLIQDTPVNLTLTTANDSNEHQ